MFAHLIDRLRCDCLLGPFFAGVNQPDGRRFGIDNVNCAAIGNMNAERDPSLIRDHPVAAGEFLIIRNRLCNNRDFVPVNLLRGKQRPVCHSNFAPSFAMNDLQRLQSFGFVMGNIDPGNAFDKCVTTNVDRRYRREKFDRSSRSHENQSLHVTSSSAAAKF